MPKCSVCSSSKTPIAVFLLLKQYIVGKGRFWYFCSPDHLKEWLDEQEDIARYGKVGVEKVITWDWERKWIDKK